MRERERDVGTEKRAKVRRPADKDGWDAPDGNYSVWDGDKWPTGG